jgi:hypothetical protein
MGDEQEPEYDGDEGLDDNEELSTYLPNLTKQDLPEAERIIETLRETLSTRRLHKDTVCTTILILFLIVLAGCV